MDAFRKQAARREEELREQKAGHQRQDDESSRLMDQVTAQMTDATQKAKIKRQTLAENESKISRLQREVRGWAARGGDINTLEMQVVSCSSETIKVRTTALPLPHVRIA